MSTLKCTKCNKESKVGFITTYKSTGTTGVNFGFGKTLKVFPVWPFVISLVADCPNCKEKTKLLVIASKKTKIITILILIVVLSLLALVAFKGREIEYVNQKDGYKISIPRSWEGKYEIKEGNNGVSFYYLGFSKFPKHEEPIIFGISAYPKDDWTKLDLLDRRWPIILEKNNMIYTYSWPVGEVPYSLADYPENLVQEYGKMSLDMKSIIQSFRLVKNNNSINLQPQGQIGVKQSGGAAILLSECSDKSYITKTADYIVEGTVEKVESKWNTEKTLIFTHSDLKIEKYDKGIPLTKDNIQIMTEGGEVGDIGQWVEDQPIFHQGKKVRIYFQGTNGDFSIICGQMGVEEISP